MTFTSLFPAILLSASLALVPTAGWAEAEHSHQAVRGDITLTLDQGAKWETDAPLRQAMTSIKAAAEEAAPAVHDGSLTADGYANLADNVEAQIEYMVANCALPPEPDEQLHILIGHLFDAAEQMRTEGNRQAGVEKVAGVLDAYAGHFQHDGWTGLSH